MDYEKLNTKLVDWIEEYVKGAGAEGTVVGLSGGIDSAVVAVLCARAFPESSLCITLPCRSAPQDLHDASLVAKTFSLDFRVIDLDEAYEVLLRTYASEHESGLAAANLKVRLRMITLYYFANSLNYLVVGTGNRAELTVGYSTKYGDGACDLMPLGELTKGDVRNLARVLGIPERIIEKPPSAGLWPGQTDEDELGFTYKDLDRYLLGEKVPDEIKAKIERLNERSRHKRRLPPIPTLLEEVQ